MFGSLLKSVVGAATLPVSFAADALTLGGALTDREGTYTASALSDIIENLNRAVDPDED